MHTTHSNTQYKNESKHSEMGPVRQNTIQKTVRSVHYVCASHCAQLLHTILHKTDLIVFPLTLETITTAPMMSIWGKGAGNPSQIHFSHFPVSRFPPLQFWSRIFQFHAFRSGIFRVPRRSYRYMGFRQLNEPQPSTSDLSDTEDEIV